MTVDELKEKIDEEVGSVVEQNGSELQRSYGCSDDKLIELCHEFITARFCES